jgi:hypothetical protein
MRTTAISVLGSLRTSSPVIAVAVLYFHWQFGFRDLGVTVEIGGLDTPTSHLPRTVGIFFDLSLRWLESSGTVHHTNCARQGGKNIIA